MKNNFSFLQLSNVITGIITLPAQAKEKKNPFVIVNTDNDCGLYVKKLMREIDKYKNVTSQQCDELLSIETSNLIVFGDSINFDYRIEMNYITLNTLMGRDVKVYDIVEDFDRIVRRLSTYCKNNGLKRKNAYRDCNYGYNVVVVEEPRVKCPVTCPLLAAKRYVAECPVKKTLVNVYSKPDVSVERVTVHANWVKIGYNQYDICVDLCGNEFITLEDGQKMFVKNDCFGRRYLTV